MTVSRPWLFAFAALIGITCVGVTPHSAAARSKRVALVIGNSAYQHTSTLVNPRHDATDVAAVLRGLGFHVVEGFDLGKTEMDRTVRDFAEALSGAQVGLFFYAGHGLQVSGENYLVPIDAKLTTAAAIDFEMIRLALVQRVMEQATETTIVFLDACRDNPLVRNLARAMGTRSAAIGRGLAAAESGVGTLISFSTQPGSVALDGKGRNSPFANALVRHLTTSQDDLSAILIGVRNMVMAETSNRQVPWEHSALRARFYFHEVPHGGGATIGTQPQLSEAAEAWAVVKDTTSEAVLKTFIAKYDGTVFGELAGARLRELNEERRDGVMAALAEPSKGVPARPASAGPFDGVWRIDQVAQRGCRNPRRTFSITVSNGVVAGVREGSVAERGTLQFVRSSGVDGRPMHYSGTFKGDTGSGKFSKPGFTCSGTFTASRS
jgi:hypothetical protein